MLIKAKFVSRSCDMEDLRHVFIISTLKMTSHNLQLKIHW